MTQNAQSGGLHALVVDDEAPSRDEIAWLLRQDPRIASVRTAPSATQALRVLDEAQIDALFLDIQMPGLTGLELAGVLNRFASQPPIVFITAHEGHALEAFDLRAVDYVLKPIRAERLAEAVRRVAESGPTTPTATDPQIPVERGGVTRFLNRSEITHVEAQGDYARLHTATDSHLIRTPLTTLAEEWADAGFVRIHRSILVSLAHVDEVRMAGGRCSVMVGTHQLAVSRRHTRELRDLLTRRTP